jgi:hypothetical protein
MARLDEHGKVNGHVFADDAKGHMRWWIGRVIAFVQPLMRVCAWRLSARPWLRRMARAAAAAMQVEILLRVGKG